MYGQEKLSAYARVSITRTEKCLLLLLDEYMKEYIYICPIDGYLKKDCAEVNALFPEENKTGTEEVILYQGMYIKRYYDAEREEYKITELREAEAKVTLHHEWRNHRSIACS